VVTASDVVSTWRDIPPYWSESENPIVAEQWERPRATVEVDELVAAVDDETDNNLRAMIRDANYRGTVNQRIAAHLGLPYVASTARLPFRRVVWDRRRAFGDRLMSIDELDAAQAERAATVGSVGPEPFVVPVFLAIALRGKDSPRQLWEALAGLREQATKFRQRRAELDRSLEDRDTEQTARVATAVRTEASKLSALTASAATAAGGTLLGELQANPQLALAVAPLDWLKPGIAALLAGVRQFIPASVRQRLAWGLRRPELRFLSDVSSEARAITDAMPSVQRLWGLPDARCDEFVRRFDVFASGTPTPR
jgi:hypothetical protein